MTIVSVPDRPRLILDNGSWILDEDLTYQLNGRKTVVRKGTRTDLASLPRFARIVAFLIGVLIDEARGVAAIWHDEAYRLHGTRGGDGEVRQLSRKEADAGFKLILHIKGVANWRANVMYYGLRIGGWWAWGKA